MATEWARREGEPILWYNRFERYRLMGAARSLLGAYREDKRGQKGTMKNVPTSWRNASEKWEWRNRVEAWDLSVLDEERKKREADYRAEIERHRRTTQLLAQSALNNAVNILKKTNDRLATMTASEIQPAMIPGYLRAAAAVAEAALNSEAQALAVEQILRSLDGDQPINAVA